MSYVPKGAICITPGCHNVHAGRSRHCAQHCRRTHPDPEEYGNLTTARNVLTTPDPVYRPKTESVQVLNLLTWTTKTVRL